MTFPCKWICKNVKHQSEEERVYLFNTADALKFFVTIGGPRRDQAKKHFLLGTFVRHFAGFCIAQVFVDHEIKDVLRMADLRFRFSLDQIFECAISACLSLIQIKNLIF